jgi:hypothetical protein
MKYESMITFLVTDGNYCCVGWLLFQSADTQVAIWFDLISLLSVFIDLMGSQARSKINSSKGMTWKYTTKYSTRQCALVLSV